MTQKRIIGDKKAQSVLGLAIFLIGVAIFFGMFSVRDIGATKGSHTGTVTAVEYNSNLIWEAELVYFKTDTQSSQEDIYCVNDEAVKQKLIDYSKNKTMVTIYYENDFIMFAWECNGGNTIIYDVMENVK